MFRTKHLFVFLIIGACVVVVIGVWVVVRDTSTTSDTLNKASTFLNAPESTYGVIVTTDEAKKEKNSAFIERIRAALKNELPTVIDSQITVEDEVMSKEQNSEPVDVQEDVYEAIITPSADLPLPTSATYEASHTAPLSTTTSATTGPSIGSE